MKFTVASSPGHYQAAQRFMRAYNVVEKQGLGFPTIMAWVEDELIGICGTRIVDKMILAGPLVVRTDYRRLFTILRLCEAYEAAMKELGITSFILSVEHGSILQRGIERYFPTMQPCATKDGYDSYIWRVKGYGDQGRSSGSDPGGEGASAQPS